MDTITKNLLKEKLEKATPQPNGCLIHPGKPNKPNGYPQIYIIINKKKIRYLAHRLSYELNVAPIPAGKFVLHSRECNNTKCVNPAHLRIGSMQENTDDMMALGRHGNTKLSEADIPIIRNRNNTIKELMNIFKVSKSTIIKARTCKTWKHI